MLIVEDSMINAIALQCLFQQFGVPSDIAYDSHGAFELIRDRFLKHQVCYKLIVLDQFLSRFNGTDMAKKIDLFMQE